jgi:hypothetical protein
LIRFFHFFCVPWPSGLFLDLCASMPAAGSGRVLIKKNSAEIDDLRCCLVTGVRAQLLRPYAISSSLLTRSSMGGWVEKRDMSPPPVRGLTMNMCAVAGVAAMGMR